VQRVREWVGIHHEDNTFQPGRSRTQCIKTQFKIYPLHWIDLWKLYPTFSMYNWDITVCVHGSTKKHGGSSQKFMFAGVLSLLQSFKGGANRFPESVVTWDIGSLFYSKRAVMQWTYPSSLRATKCKVCQYAGRLWHLYSLLQESSELYSYFEIQIECEHMLWHAVLTALGY